MRLRDKVVLITGSTTGIGEAIARRCVAEGARVLIHGRDKNRGTEILSDLNQAAALHIDDLADPQAPKRLVSAALDHFGKIDALINNAAFIVRSELGNTDSTLFDQVMAVNVRAPLLLIQAAIDELKKQHGAVLNIGSVNAHCGESTLLAYSISKGALLTLSRNLADSLAHDQVRINHFNVGWVLTPNEHQLQLNDGQVENWHQNLPLSQAPTGRLIQPEEIATAAIYWISDESKPFNGTVLELEQYPVIGRNPTKGDHECLN